MVEFPENFIKAFFLKRDECFREFSPLNAVNISLLTTRRKKLFQHIQLQRAPSDVSHVQEEIQDIIKNDNGLGCYNTGRNMTQEELNLDMSRLIFPIQNTQDIFPTSPISPTLSTLPEDGYEVLPNITYPLPHIALEFFSQSVRQGLYKHILIELPQLIEAFLPNTNMLRLAGSLPVYSFQDNMFRRMDWLDRFYLPSDTSFSFPATGLCVYGAHFDAECNSWVLDYWRIYGDDNVLDYVDYVLWWNWNADVYHSMQPPLRYTKDATTLNTNCYVKDYFCNRIKEEIRSELESKSSFLLTNKEAVYLNFFNPLTINKICLTGDALNNTIGTGDVHTDRTIMEKRVDGLYCQSVLADKTITAFHGDYQRTENTRIQLSDIPQSSRTREILIDFFNREFPSSGIIIREGAWFYKQAIKDVGNNPINIFSNTFIPEFVIPLNFKRSETMAFSEGNFRFMSFYLGYTLGRDVSDASGIHTETGQLKPLVFIVKNEGIYENNFWIVKSINYYCAGRTVNNFIHKIIDLTYGDYTEQVSKFQSSKEYFNTLLIKEYDNHTFINNEDIESLFYHFRTDAAKNITFPLTPIEKRTLQSFRVDIDTVIISDDDEDFDLI